jgi:hypothetical protein
MNSYDKLVELASTPDPDAPPCEYCGGGLAHYPECVELAPQVEPDLCMHDGVEDASDCPNAPRLDILHGPGSLS